MYDDASSRLCLTLCVVPNGTSAGALGAPIRPPFRTEGRMPGMELLSPLEDEGLPK